MTERKQPSVEITVIVGSAEYVGWISSQLTHSLEDISGTFSIPVDFDIDSPPAIRRQDEVTIKLGDKVVIKGVVLKADPFYSRDDIGMQIEGRDYTGDLVSGAAIHEGGQWLNASLETIVSDICKPYGVSVLVEVDTGKPFARFELENGETAHTAIARAASYRGVLVTRNVDGQLLLTRAGKNKSHAAIVAGKGGNVLSMQPLGTDEERHSEYIVQGQGETNHIGDGSKAHQLEHSAKDPEFKRYLPIIVQADTSAEARDVQEQAEHMARVNMAKAYKYQYTLGGWAIEGKPWEINTRVPVVDPALNLDGEEWLIVAVDLSVDREAGDVVNVTIAPIAAYEQRTLKEPKQRKDNLGNKKKHSKARTPKADKDIAPDWS